MNNDIRTFEQRMREHRQQYEQQRTGKAPNPRPSRAESKVAPDFDDMYLHEQEDDKYIVVDHNMNMMEDDVADMDDARQPTRQEMIHNMNQGDSIQMQPMHRQGAQQPVQRAQQTQRQNAQMSTGVMEMNADRPVPETLGSSLFTPGYLRTQIGKLVRVEFLIGTNGMNDRTGILSDVGVSFIILQSLDGVSQTMCDMYSIKFVTIMETDSLRDLVDRI